MIFTFHNRKQRGRGREERWRGGDRGVSHRERDREEETGEDTEGKKQRGRDRGEETEGKRQRGRDRGEEPDGKRRRERN
jgi:hypothetical protein